MTRIMLAAPLSLLALAASGASAVAPSSPAKVGGQAPVVIAAVGDISGRGMAQAATARLLSALHPDAILLLGDIAYGVGSAAQYRDEFAPSWGAFKPLLRPVPGNHDHATAGLGGYCGYFGTAAHCQDGMSYYAYDLGAWHLIALDSGCSAPARCSTTMDVGSPMVAWLKQDLAQNPKLCTLAYWHHPRFSSGPHGNDTRSAAVWKLLYGAGVDVILTGHDHTYERFAPMDPVGAEDVPHGITEYVVGTGGADFYNFASVPKPHSLARENRVHGVLKMTLWPDRYDWEFVPAEEAAFVDRGTARCHRPPSPRSPSDPGGVEQQR